MKPNEQKMEWSSKKLKKRKNARFQRSHPNRTKRSEFVAIWHQTTQNEKNLSKLKGAKYRAARQMALFRKLIYLFSLFQYRIHFIAKDLFMTEIDWDVFLVSTHKFCAMRFLRNAFFAQWNFYAMPIFCGKQNLYDVLCIIHFCVF